ncbi:MAG: VWA domain-containing protein [Pseudonocardia sp.]
MLQRRGPARPGRRPLARKPKALTEEPVLFDAATSGPGPVLEGGGPPADPRGAPRGGLSAAATGEVGELVAPDGSGPVDPVVREQARRIAARLRLRRPRRCGPARRGSGPLASLPYRGGSDDIDLDRTIEVLTERPVPEDTDIVVRERVSTRHHVVLAVDVSGSMRGERVRTAAAAVGALAGELHRDDLGVLAFWSDAAVLLELGAPVRPDALLDALLRLPARGLTNVSFPLEVAARTLARAPRTQARAVLLTDAVHNAGPDPRPAAARLPRLDVLLDTSGEHDAALGAELAAAGHGLLAPVRTHRDVAPALTRFFAR